jgi:hypothetical protein
MIDRFPPDAAREAASTLTEIGVRDQSRIEELP